MIMDMRKNIAVVAAGLWLSSSVYELKATSLAELQARFAAYGDTFSGELREQIQIVQQELAYCVKVEARDPWDFFAEKMSSSYPFFKEYAISPVKIYFPKETSEEGPVFTKSQWGREHCKILLARLERIRNLAEAEDLSTELREEFQNLLQEATAFIQVIHDGNQRICLEEDENLERQRAETDLEAYAASIPDDLKEIFIYLQNPERLNSDVSATTAEMFEKQIQFMNWQVEHTLTPYLPNDADREQFFATNERIRSEAVEGL
jgi:hypothetical protein